MLPSTILPKITKRRRRILNVSEKRIVLLPKDVKPSSPINATVLRTAATYGNIRLTASI